MTLTDDTPGGMDAAAARELVGCTYLNLACDERFVVTHIENRGTRDAPTPYAIMEYENGMRWGEPAEVCGTHHPYLDTEPLPLSLSFYSPDGACNWARERGREFANAFTAPAGTTSESATEVFHTSVVTGDTYDTALGRTYFEVAARFTETTVPDHLLAAAVQDGFVTALVKRAEAAVQQSPATVA